MSEENVEIARRGIVEINSFYRTGEFSLLQELCDPDFVLQPSGMFPEHEEMRGPEGLLKFIRGQTEAFERMWIEAEEFLDAGDRVVIPIRFGGRARHTGLDASTASNSASLQGSSSPIPTRRSAPGARSRQAATKRLEGSIAATFPAPRTSASMTVSAPVPQPTSSARWPARTPVTRTISRASSAP